MKEVRRLLQPQQSAALRGWGRAFRSPFSTGGQHAFEIKNVIVGFYHGEKRTMPHQQWQPKRRDRLVCNRCGKTIESNEYEPRLSDEDFKYLSPPPADAPYFLLANGKKCYLYKWRDNAFYLAPELFESCPTLDSDHSERS
jgi:hypothetical protein